MKRLTTYLNERLIINKNYKNTYTCVPKSFNELRKIIKQRYEEQGPGTEQNPIDFNDIDVSNVNSFCNDIEHGLFEYTYFEYIDISKWDVSNVENMNSMFWDCMYLKSVGDISNWKVSNVKDMRYMFRKCKQLKSVGDLSKWKVSKFKTNINGMFRDSGITNIPDWYEE